MTGHASIEAEARQVVQKEKQPRNAVVNPALPLTRAMLKGIDKATVKVAGYASGIHHDGTFYREFEGIQQYPDEPFIRVVMYGDEFHDIETRIPLSALKAAGFVRKGQ